MESDVESRGFDSLNGRISHVSRRNESLKDAVPDNCSSICVFDPRRTEMVLLVKEANPVRRYHSSETGVVRSHTYFEVQRR